MLTIDHALHKRIAKGIAVDKYSKLWEYVSSQNKDALELTFDQIGEISGVPIDHSFLSYKKNLLPYGFEVDHVFMKKELVRFKRT